jgi:hypothetical protein
VLKTCCSYEEGVFAGDLDAQSGESHTSLRVTPLHVFTIVCVCFWLPNKKHRMRKWHIATFQQCVRAARRVCGLPTVASLEHALTNLVQSICQLMTCMKEPNNDWLA